MGNSNGPAGPSTSNSTRASQRIVLLARDERSEGPAEYPGADPDKVNVNEEVPKFATEHAGKLAAIESARANHSASVTSVSSATNCARTWHG
jgi:hypothetical protein